MAYVASDGSFGAGEVVSFDDTALNDEQWDEMALLPESERISYARTLIAGEATPGGSASDMERFGRFVFEVMDGSEWNSETFQQISDYAAFRHWGHVFRARRGG